MSHREPGAHGERDPGDPTDFGPWLPPETSLTDATRAFQEE